MRVSLIVAMSENGVIGCDGDLPWRLSADLRRFKRLTMGHHIIMGRRTFESIGRLLPGRTTVVVTRQPDYSAGEALVADSVPGAIAMAAGDEETFVCGGAEIYRAALADVQRVYLTRVHARVDGDTEFPEIDWTQWRQTESTPHIRDDRNQYDYTSQVYERIGRRAVSADPTTAG